MKRECWLFLRENKQKGAKGGCEPCPASTAGYTYILAHFKYNINRMNMIIFKKNIPNPIDSFYRMMVKKS